MENRDQEKIIFELCNIISYCSFLLTEKYQKTRQAGAAGLLKTVRKNQEIQRFDHRNFH